MAFEYAQGLESCIQSVSILTILLPLALLTNIKVKSLKQYICIYRTRFFRSTVRLNTALFLFCAFAQCRQSIQCHQLRSNLEPGIFLSYCNDKSTTACFFFPLKPHRITYLKFQIKKMRVFQLKSKVEQSFTYEYGHCIYV